jgi:hypothetical protein
MVEVLVVLMISVVVVVTMDDRGGVLGDINAAVTSVYVDE